jgi:sec-independent protein translocase protein TatA
LTILKNSSCLIFRKFAKKIKVMILGTFGPWQVIAILAVALLLFGGKKIPELMKGLGKGMKEFKDASKGEEKEEEIKQ